MMVSHQTHSRLLASLLAATLLAGAPAVVTAQQDGEQVTAQATLVEPSDEQLELNAEAVGAIQSGDYDKAIKLLEASNALGEMNVTWLNLGRAYHKLGECEKARDAYIKVISAPAVRDPSSRLINAKADTYLRELEGECEISEETKHKMAAASGEQQESSDQAEPVEPAAPAAQPAAESSNALGWTLTAGGLLMAGAGVGAHFWAESIRDDVTTSIEAANRRVVSDMSRQQALDKESQANTLDTVGVSAIAVGAIATGTGVFLLLSTDDVEAAPSASISAGGDVSIGLTGSF